MVVAVTLQAITLPEWIDMVVWSRSNETYRRIAAVVVVVVQRRMLQGRYRL